MPRRLPRAALCLALLAATVGVGSRARADPPAAARKRRFYRGRDEGSEALFSPMWVFLNRGFDTLQLRRGSRSPIVDRRWSVNLDNVLANLEHPAAAISRQGAGKWAREELLPLTFTGSGARWAPNYSLHLIGGGVDFVGMREWFEAEGVPLAAAWSGVTLYAAALANEAIENHDIVGTNTDALADLLVFDLAGILLFSVDDVADFFSEDLLVYDWSLQPTYTAPRGQLENQGSYYAVQLPLPFHRPLRLFAYGGYSTLGGLSYVLPSGHTLSAAAGVKIDELRRRQMFVVDNVVTMKPAAAVFLDRRGSLLASLQLAPVADYAIHVNVYPNWLFRSRPGVGFWAALGMDGGWAGGLSFTGAPWGLGVEAR